MLHLIIGIHNSYISWIVIIICDEIGENNINPFSQIHDKCHLLGYLLIFIDSLFDKQYCARTEQSDTVCCHDKSSLKSNFEYMQQT